MVRSPLPIPQKLSLEDIGPIVDQILSWLKERKRCVLQTYVSQAVKIALALQTARSDLSGLTMIVGSEPLTRNKKEEIEATGARVYHRYMATELGTIAMGCGNPHGVDDLHLMSDMVAMIQNQERDSEGPAPLFFSSLNLVMPKIFLNTMLGDMAESGRRNCGCAFEELGFATHISTVRSYSRFTAEGMAVSRLAMERIIDSVLKRRRLGTSLDYQLVETERKDGKTELKIRLSPSVGEVDSGKLVTEIFRELEKAGEGEALMASIWQKRKVISIVREEPKPTGRGKILSLLKEQ